MQYPAFQPLALPPGTFTWALGERAAYMGALAPSYGKASQSLEYLAGMHISASEIALCATGLGHVYTLPEVPHHPAESPPSPDVTYVAADAVMVRFLEDNAWHEVKVFATWSALHGRTSPVRYWTKEGSWDLHWADFETLAE